MANRFRECMTRKFLASQTKNDRPPAHLRNAIIRRTKNANVGTIPYCSGNELL